MFWLRVTYNVETPIGFLGILQPHKEPVSKFYHHLIGYNSKSKIKCIYFKILLPVLTLSSPTKLTLQWKVVCTFRHVVCNTTKLFLQRSTWRLNILLPMKEYFGTTPNLQSWTKYLTQTLVFTWNSALR